jgi:SRSO17 transposase
LRDLKDRIRGLFTQERVATSANLFLDGLLGAHRRKTGWMRAEAAGDLGPWRQQAILGRGRWDADGLRNIVRDYVVEHLATNDAVLVIDETGFLKQGKASCGVAHQYTGSAGKITNYQIGVFAAYVSARGHAFIDRALYLPKSWTGDPAPLAAAHVLDAVAFTTDLPLSFPPSEIRVRPLIDPIPLFGPPEGGVFQLLHDGGLVAPSGLINEIGILWPIAPCGRTSL